MGPQNTSSTATMARNRSCSKARNLTKTTRDQNSPCSKSSNPTKMTGTQNKSSSKPSNSQKAKGAQNSQVSSICNSTKVTVARNMSCARPSNTTKETAARNTSCVRPSNLQKSSVTPRNTSDNKSSNLRKQSVARNKSRVRTSSLSKGTTSRDASCSRSSNSQKTLAAHNKPSNPRKPSVTRNTPSSKSSSAKKLSVPRDTSSSKSSLSRKPSATRDSSSSKSFRARKPSVARDTVSSKSSSARTPTVARDTLSSKSSSTRKPSVARNSVSSKSSNSTKTTPAQNTSCNKSNISAKATTARNASSAKSSNLTKVTEAHNKTSSTSSSTKQTSVFQTTTRSRPSNVSQAKAAQNAADAKSANAAQETASANASFKCLKPTTPTATVKSSSSEFSSIKQVESASNDLPSSPDLKATVSEYTSHSYSSNLTKAVWVRKSSSLDLINVIEPRNRSNSSSAVPSRLNIARRKSMARRLAGNSRVSICGEPEMPYDSGSTFMREFMDFSDRQCLRQPKKEQMALKAARVIQETKRSMGQRFLEKPVPDDIDKWPFKVVEKGGRAALQVTFKKNDTQIYSPEEITAIVLGKMKQVAENFLGHKVTNAVFTFMLAMAEYTSPMPPAQVDLLLIQLYITVVDNYFASETPKPEPAPPETPTVETGAPLVPASKRRNSIRQSKLTPSSRRSLVKKNQQETELMAVPENAENSSTQEIQSH